MASHRVLGVLLASLLLATAVSWVGHFDTPVWFLEAGSVLLALTRRHDRQLAALSESCSPHRAAVA